MFDFDSSSWNGACGCSELNSSSSSVGARNGQRIAGATTVGPRLKENGIEPPTVDRERHGAIGRFRMRAGLIRDAAKRGFVVIDGKKIMAPGAKRRVPRRVTA